MVQNMMFVAGTIKTESFWILMKQEMMEWQCHQLDDMQIIHTSFQTDNHTRTQSCNFLWVSCSFCCLLNSVKAFES